MKKIFMFSMLVFAVLFGSVASVSAQSKDLKKATKKRVKELEKAGWTMQASTTTMEYAMLKYNTYLEEDEDNRIALTGIAVGKNPKIGRENAIQNAISSYASRAKAQVVGKVKSVMSSDASVSVEEIDKFGAAYESGVNTKISGLVKQHFVLVRTNDDGTKEYNVFLSINEAEAKKARQQAAEDARKQTTLGNLSQQVTDFIGEPVEADE